MLIAIALLGYTSAKSHVVVICGIPVFKLNLLARIAIKIVWEGGGGPKCIGCYLLESGLSFVFHPLNVYGEDIQ